MNRRVAIVIPAYNARETIAGSVTAALMQQDVAAEVIVVDDGSTDETAIVARNSGARVIQQSNGGPAKARNAGWRGSTGDIVLFTDSDCVPEPSWARALIDGFADDQVGAVTGSYGIANDDVLLARLIQEEIIERHVAYRPFVKVFGSYNVAIRRDVLERTGGFDETYRRASAEDNDLSYRITQAGFRIAFAQKAIVGHYHPESLPRYLREQYRHGFWRMKLYRSHPGMAGGDDYTVMKDVVEPPLAVATLASLVTLPFVWWLTPALGAVLLAIQFPAAVRIARRTGDWSHLALAPVTFLRGFARGLGMCAGIARFYLHLGHAQ